MITIKEILNRIDYIEYTGSKELFVNKIVPLEEIQQSTNALCWCNDSNSVGLNKIKTSSIIIVSKNIDNDILSSLNCIIVENPRRTFQDILTKFFMSKRESKIHSSAKIAPGCEIGQNVFIGHNVVVEENCKMGHNVVILHNTVILEGTVLGSNISIGSNNTIGGIGFGYEKNKEGDFELIPHIGNVIIKDNVDIGNNTCIDRAVLGSTILEENVKIDNLVHIAHGVHIGRNSVVIANAMVAGSVIIGENTWIAPSSSILNQLQIGNNVTVGMAAVVLKSVKDGDVVVGSPAKSIKK